MKISSSCASEFCIMSNNLVTEFMRGGCKLKVLSINMFVRFYVHRPLSINGIPHFPVELSNHLAHLHYLVPSSFRGYPLLSHLKLYKMCFFVSFLFKFRYRSSLLTGILSSCTLFRSSSIN